MEWRKHLPGRAFRSLKAPGEAEDSCGLAETLNSAFHPRS